MNHERNDHHRQMVGFIQLLNDIGINIVEINNSFYAFTSFECADDILPDHELMGRDVTKIVEDEVANAASTQLKKNELISRINEIPLRRRKFHRDMRYSQYLTT
jgi:hypothetical protein